MAKVTGALFSIDASGTYAGKLTFAKWKGTQYVRNHVIPSNPMTVNQEKTRNAVRILGAGQKFANAMTTKRSGETLTDKAELATRAPSGQAWNGYLVKSGCGPSMANWDTATTAWTALTAPNKTTWDTAAAALAHPISAVAQKGAGGVAATAATAGQVYYMYCYALYFAGVASAPPVAATPPTYA